MTILTIYLIFLGAIVMIGAISTTVLFIVALFSANKTMEAFKKNVEEVSQKFQDFFSF